MEVCTTVPLASKTRAQSTTSKVTDITPNPTTTTTFNPTPTITTTTSTTATSTTTTTIPRTTTATSTTTTADSTTTTADSTTSTTSSTTTTTIPRTTTADSTTTTATPSTTTTASTTTTTIPRTTTADSTTTTADSTTTTADSTTTTAALPVTTADSTTTTADSTTTTADSTTTTADSTTTTADSTTTTAALPVTTADSTTTTADSTTTTADSTTTTAALPVTTADSTTTTADSTTTTADSTTTTADSTTTTADSTTTTAALPVTTADSTTTTADSTTTTADSTTTTAALPVTTADSTTTTADSTTTTADSTTTTADSTTTTAALPVTTADSTTTTADSTTTTAALPVTTADSTTTTADSTTTTAALPVTTADSTTTTADSTTTTADSTTTTADSTTTTADSTTTTADSTTTTADSTTTTADSTTTTADSTTTTAALPVTTAITPAAEETTAQTGAPTSQPGETTLAVTSALPETVASQTAGITATEAPTPTTIIISSESQTSTILTTTPTAPTTTPTSTPTPTTMTTTATTPLHCDNGGQLLNGVCVCPDEWTGETCSKENFCQARGVEGFTFPKTPVGWFAYSNELCPSGTSGARKPRASIRCSNSTGSPGFDGSPQVLECDQTLSNILQNLTSVADLETLASSTQILTSRPEELTAENVTTAAQIANTLLLSPNATESVRVAAVATVSQLLNASAPEDTEENNTTLGLTVTLDQLSVNLSTSLNTSQSQVIQPNLVVQSARIPAADTQGVQFTSLTGASGSFVANRIQLNTNTSRVVVENGFTADALIYVQFPASGEAVNRRQEPSNVSLGFVLYQNDRFFRSRLYRRRRSTIRVLSATVKGHERSVVPQHVEIVFRPALVNGTSLYDFACVFWDYGLEDWSTAGCSKGNASDGVLRCFCNHTTNFAALWSFRENYEYAQALDWISITGLSLSVLGLVVTIIYHIKENFQRTSRQNNKNSKIALLCIYVSLLAFIITFLSGVQNSHGDDGSEVQTTTQSNVIPDSDEHVEPDHGSCTAVAALLHFFLLATFMWNSVYGTQLVLLIRTMGSSLPPHWTPLSVAVGWGVPAVAVAITLGATYRVNNPLGYRQEEFCWLAGLDKDKRFDFGKPMFWAFILPVGLILIYNIVLMVLTSLTICRTDPRLTSTNRSSLGKKFLTSFSLAVILGLSWSLGYLVLINTKQAHLVFSIIFCLCTTTQGLQIFILFTARKASFRATISRSVQYVASVNIPLHNATYSLLRKWSRNSSESYKDIKDQNTSTSKTL
ncbi:adhesion G-protein coupled receptor G7-like [Trachinotus anak]|uniref:adhesion G-protein coupled receptor G7-like n=1 Tax=Trachinotus anak TaxID=443729 RepID=UPI0039F19CAB